MKSCVFLWAKKRVTEDGEIHHPLLFHMLDVGWVAGELWSRVLHGATRSFFMTELGFPEEEAMAWICFLAALHDTGKASPAFQRQSDEITRLLQTQGFPFQRFAERCPHGIITADVLAALLQDLCKPTEFPRELGKTLGLTVGGHHGVFDGGKSKPGQRGTEQAWIDARRELITLLAQLFSVSTTAIPRFSQSRAFYILLAGLTCVADWIGSNEQYFPYEPSGTDPTQYVILARQRATEAVRAVGWADWRPPRTTAIFGNLFPFIKNPRPLQDQVTTLAPSLSGLPSLVIIEAPMGEGKTEAAIFLADYWGATRQQQGCYFALPTQATSNQMFGRVNRFLTTRYPTERVSTQLVHGANLLSEEFRELLLQTYPEDGGSGAEERGRVTVEEWFLPKKRALLAPFGVGTIDQALLTVLQTRHFFVRLFGLAHKTIIIDEVHAYDTYMSVLLERLLEWLRALGCSVILLSATLPAWKRRNLLLAFSGKEPVQTGKYPRITWVSGEDAGTIGFPADQQKRLTLHHLSDDVAELVHALREAIADGGCIAVVCNTVGRAQNVYRALKEAWIVEPEVLYLFHARFPFDERDEREKIALSAFGKEGQRPQSAILVATQIIEQSLDLDFDLMVTDLAPADLVLQRAGRIHRHERVRPARLMLPSLWLRMPSMGDEHVPDFGPSERIYDRYILLRSYLALKDRKRIQVPEDLEIIVEEVYGDEGSWPSQEFRQAAATARAKMEREIERDMFRAKGNLIDSPDSPGTPDEFLERFSKNLDEDNPEVHQALQALTRLAEPSVQVVCLMRTPEGYRLRSGGQTVDLKAKPDAALIRAFLRRAMTLTDKRVVFSILQDERLKPPGWKENAALRYHRALIFTEGAVTVGRYVLRLDPELGLTIDPVPTETDGGNE